MNAEQVRAELDRIVDPCSAVAGAPAGLVEMGLVRELSLRHEAGGTAIRVRIGVTEPGCLMGASFAVQARERLERLPGVSRIDVELDHAADWKPADIDADYARRLETVRQGRRESLRRTRGARPAG